VSPELRHRIKSRPSRGRKRNQQSAFEHDDHSTPAPVLTSFLDSIILDSWNQSTPSRLWLPSPRTADCRSTASSCKPAPTASPPPRLRSAWEFLRATLSAETFPQKPREGVHLLIIRRVVDEAARLPGLTRSAYSGFQVDESVLGRNSQALRNLGGGDAVGAGLHDEAVDLQSAVLGEGSKAVTACLIP